MVYPLITFENLHEILRHLYDDMMPLCQKLTTLAAALACIGALLYISYRVWKSLANAEPIDVFPLLRPFALCICIIFFKTLVVGGLNGILSPVVLGTHSILKGQIFDMQQHQDEKDKLEKENMMRDPNTAYLVSDEEYDRQIKEMGWSPGALNDMENMYEQRKFYGIRGLFQDLFRWLLELIFEAASLILDTIRTFYLVVLSILGPIVFAIASFDGFQATLAQWLTKYISVYLWLPVADLFGAVLARLQVLSLQKDMELMATDPFYFFDSNNLVYFVFLLIGIGGYFAVPSVASWIVQAGGFNSYNRIAMQGSKSIGKYIYAAGGYVGGYAASQLKEVFSEKNNPKR